MSNKTLLIKSSYLISLTEEEYSQKHDDILLAISNVIGKDFSISANSTLEWESLSTVLLESSSTNCGSCSNCNSWVTDRGKENHIEELTNGAVVNGQLLCDECLPDDHRWAF